MPTRAGEPGQTDPSRVDPDGDDAPPPDDPLAALRALPADFDVGGADRLRAVVAAWPRSLQWAAAAAGVAVVAVLAVLLLRPAPPEPESVIPLASTVDMAPPTAPATTVLGPVLAHAAGAVSQPGVYELGPGARVRDLVTAAGGPTADADLDRLNLAGPIEDGARVWVPRVGEEAAPAVVTPEPGATEAAAEAEAGAESALVDVNTATAEELEALPGIGPTTAAAIVDHREANGPFTTVDDLLDVRGIGDAKLDQLREHVAL